MKKLGEAAFALFWVLIGILILITIIGSLSNHTYGFTSTVDGYRVRCIVNIEQGTQGMWCEPIAEGEE